MSLLSMAMSRVDSLDQLQLQVGQTPGLHSYSCRLGDIRFEFSKRRATAQTMGTEER
jgi:hypothetical protein